MRQHVQLSGPQQEPGPGLSVNAENITVSAPTNSAFEKIPAEDLNALLAAREKLTVSGSVQTANATVYLVDPVLMPKK